MDDDDRLKQFDAAQRHDIRIIQITIAMSVFATMICVMCVVSG